MPVKSEDILSLYKYLHANPELSWQEDKTANLLSGMLEGYGFDVSRGIGKKGVVAIYENGEGPTLMIRADMDALPVEEKNKSSVCIKNKIN
jgi:hippurate hydrolase